VVHELLVNLSGFGDVATPRKEDTLDRVREVSHPRRGVEYNL
jgi:hypothetical protein